MKLPFVQIDAFAGRPFTGNPAAVMPLDAWLADEMLQAIAAENNLAETAFLIPDASGAADYELRWFTPLIEVALCGHATLASGHYILGKFPDRERVTFRTRKAGILEVARDGDRYRMALPAYPAESKPLPEVLAALGVEQAKTFWHPGQYALVVLDTAEAVLALRPRFPRACRAGRRAHHRHCPRHRYRRDQPRLRPRRGDRRGSGDGLGAFGADALLGRPARPRQLHRISGESARRPCRLHAGGGSRDPGRAMRHADQGDVPAS